MFLINIISELTNEHKSIQLKINVNGLIIYKYDFDDYMISID